ncbi:hypothetical protein FRB94_007759 [Tulasnella sp. JGI-2019a]|nr:hypothetical protein FRB93_011144 [Tulasnella sp. JGI-2019a]KAG9011768.1 hypothetical protein FRB94_007759 [Tulasnella sp. JGI-2019a]
MDVHTLTTLFATTFGGDTNQRRAAELEIRRISTHEGMLTALMQIIGNNALDLSIRQACVVFFKNRVSRSYHIDPAEPKPDQAPIPATDRLAIKQNIIPLLIAAPSRLIRVQLTACIKILVTNDFPEQWPDLLSTVVKLLSSDDLATVYGGLLVNLEIFKSYRYRSPKEEKLIPKIIKKTFPILVSLGQKLIPTQGPPPLPPLDAAEFLHVILKTYKYSIASNLSKHQQTHDSIVAWGTLLFQVVNMQLPTGVTLSGDKDEWEKHAWWKAKKWALSTLNRLFERYGNPTHIPKPLQKEYLTFANHFVTAFAPEIFKQYLQQIELYIGGQAWMSNKCLNLVFNFFGSCIKPKATWALLKPHAQTLVSRLAFPQLRFDAEKAELFENDPVEYVRFAISEFEDYNSPRSAAVGFLLNLATTRAKTEFMGILNFINSVLNAGTAVTPEDKYAALTMIVALAAVIMRNSEVRPAMEAFCVNHVLPEFASPVGLMREVACQVIGNLSSYKLEWKDPKNHEASFRALVAAMDDPQLPVRVQAAISLGETLHDESVKHALLPGLEKIMQDLFKLSDETDIDQLSETLEGFIEEFKDQLLPVSPQIIARLCQSYMRVLGEQSAKVDNAEADDNDLNTNLADLDTDDKTFALMGITKTIQTVLGCFDELEELEDVSKAVASGLGAQQHRQVNPAILLIQDEIIPIIEATLKTQVLELYDTAWELVDTLTYRTRRVVPAMWPVLKLTYDLFKSTAVDYLEEMLPGLCNFLLFGSEGFVQNPDYTRMVLEIFVTALTDDHLGDHDAVNGFKLIESVMLNLKGHIDQAIPTIINTTLTKYSTTENPALKLAALDTLVITLFYNPALALRTLDAAHPNGSREFFDKWFTAMNSEKGLPRVHDKKLTILTLCELLKMDLNDVPVGLKEGWNGLVAGILSVFKGLPEAEQRKQELLTSFEDTEDEDDEDDENDMDEDFAGIEDDEDQDGDVFDDETAYLDMLAEEGAKLRAKQAKRVAKAQRKAAEAGVGTGKGPLAAGIKGDDDGDDSDYSEAIGSGADSEDEDSEDEESDEEDLNEDLSIETIVDDVDAYEYFKQTLAGLQNSNPQVYQAVTTSLTVDQQTELMEVMAHKPEAEAAEAPAVPST